MVLQLYNWMIKLLFLVSNDGVLSYIIQFVKLYEN